MTNSKVLIIDNSLFPTGALISILSFVKHLKDRYEFQLILDSRSKVDILFIGEQFKIFNVTFVEISKRLKTLLYLPVLAINSLIIIRKLKRENISILHCNDLYNMLGVIAKVFYPKIKLVYHVRLLPTSYASKFYSIWVYLIEKYADQIICVSEAVAKNFNRDVKIIFDSIDLPNFTAPRTNNDVISALYLANYTEGKGHDLAIHAFAKASKSCPNLRMTMYGDTFNIKKNLKYKDKLISLVKKKSLSHKIKIKNFTIDKPYVYKQAELFLNFSYSESFSMTTLESLAYGTPAIVTKCGGPSEIIEDGISGTLVPIGDVDSMANAIVKLAQSQELRQAFSRNGKKRFANKFSLDEQAKKLSNLYNELLISHQ